MLPKLFFFYFAAMITGISVLVVTRKNPVHSVLWMLLLFFNIAGLYLFLNAEMIAVIQVIVYAGAILVLFLFVVLLLDLKKEIAGQQYTDIWSIAVSLIAGLFLLVIIAFQAFEIAEPQTKILKGFGQPAAIGQMLYTEYLFPFEIASVILLVAIIGAIVLAKRKLKG